MSYSIKFHHPDEPRVDLRPLEMADPWSRYGNSYCDITITYNVAKWLYETIDEERGIRWLDGKTGRETQERLFRAVQSLGTDYVRDGYAKEPGNAGIRLMLLLTWALQFPDAVWEAH